MTSTYTVKVPTVWPQVDSAQVRFFLSNPFATRAVVMDPGAGDRVLRLSLPTLQVAALASSLGEPPAVALRRLIATRLQAPSQQESCLPFETVFEPPLSVSRSESTQTGSSSLQGESLASWIDAFVLVVIIVGGALLVWWLLFRKRNSIAPVPQPQVPQSIVSNWSPLP
jgi:hypothetical protein